MAVLQFSKVVNALPATLEANTLYMVRRGNGFDFFATNSQGSIVAYPLNAPAAPMVRSFLAAETPTYRIIQNAFAHYANTYLKTGSLKITLPAITAGDSSTGSGTFVSLRFRLWEYGGRGTCWVTVDGYLQASGSTPANVWSNGTAFIEAQNRASKPIQVRLGIENGRYVILIEKTALGTDSQWLYLMCALESAHMSNGGATSTNFDDPTTWLVTYATSISGITIAQTVQPATALLTSDRVSSAVDGTVGQLLTVGYMGWGSTLPTMNNSNVDDQSLNTGQWAVTRTIYATFPVGFASGTFENKVISKTTGPNALTAYQTLTDTSNPALPRKWERSVNAGTIGIWQELRTTANLANVNEIKNGDLSVNSQGNSAPPDRFGTGGNGGAAAPASGYTLIGTGEAVPFGLKRWWTLSGNDGGFYLILPNVRRYAGRTVTFSFYVKADKAGASMAGLRFYQRMGTGGSPSATTSSYGDRDGITLTTGVQRMVCTVTLPDLSGKTLGTNDDSDLYISMNVTLGGAVVSMTGFKLEGGVAATPFEMRDEEAVLMNQAPISPAMQAILDNNGLATATPNRSFVSCDDAPMGSTIRYEGTQANATSLNYPTSAANSGSQVAFSVFTLGVSGPNARIVQIAAEVFGATGVLAGSRGRTFVRIKHDANWFAWSELATVTSPTFANTLNLLSAAGNAGMRIGRQNGAVSTPYLDFISGGNNIGYDFRLIAKGGGPSNTTTGTGQLSMLGAGVNIGTETQNNSDRLTVSGSASVSGAFRPGQFTLSTLPSASALSGYEIDVTDASGGPKRCRSNGTNWLILNTTTPVS